MKQLAFWELDNIQPKKSRRNFLHSEELSWDFDLYQVQNPDKRKVRRNVQEFSEKQLTHKNEYNIINQYDERRNSKSPKPRRFADPNRVDYEYEMIYRR